MILLYGDYAALAGKEFAMNTTKRSFAALLLCTVLFGLLCGCGNRSESGDSPEEVIAQMESACQQMDVNAALDCIVPSVARPMRSMLKLATAASETGEAELMRKLIAQYGGTNVAYEDLETACQNLKLEIVSVTPTDDTSAQAEVVASTSVGETEYAQRLWFSLVCKKGRWYISDGDLAEP